MEQAQLDSLRPAHSSKMFPAVTICILDKSATKSNQEDDFADQWTSI